MPNLRIIHTNEAPRSLASYSQAVRAAGLVFVSGQGPFDAKTGEIVGATIQEQTAQCLRNLEAILRAAGTSLDQAVSATFILGEEADFPGMNEEWAKWFPKDPPARVIVMMEFSTVAGLSTAASFPSP